MGTKQTSTLQISTEQKSILQMGTPLKEAFSHRITSMFANQILDEGGKLET